VPIYYEGCLAKLDLDAKERPRIDPDFEEVTEGEKSREKKSSNRNGRSSKPSSAQKNG